MKNLTDKKVKRCRNGHRLTKENTYVRPDGYRACRECMLEADRRYRANKLLRYGASTKGINDNPRDWDGVDKVVIK